MSWFQHILFNEVAPVVRLGRRRPLQAGDIPEIGPELEPESVNEAFATLTTHHPLRFVWDAYWASGFSAIRGLVLDCIRTPLALGGPLLMRELLLSLSSLGTNEGMLVTSLALALLLSAIVVADGVVVQHFFYYALMSWGRIANGLNMRVFRHSLRIKRSAQMKTQSGDMVNHMASDSEGMAEAAFFIPEIIQSALLVVGAMSVLFSLLGVAAVAALLTMVIMLPVTRMAAKRFRHHDTELWKHRDDRVTLMSQILSGIRAVKYFAWERSVSNEVDALRVQEIQSYFKLIRAEALGVMLFLSTSTLVAFAGFFTFVLLGGELSAALIFPCLLLFVQLENPIGSLPHFVKNLAHARVAAERLHRFFEREVLDDDARAESEPNAPLSLTLQSLGVEFEPQHIASRHSPGDDMLTRDVVQTDHVALHNIDLRISAGESIAIVGAVGSGKSTLLLSILGEVDPTTGSIVFDGLSPHLRPRIAYTSQEPYILNATIRENILFGADIGDKHGESTVGSNGYDRTGEPTREQLLRSSVHCCALEQDLLQLSAGLDTEIGERGVTLSGGQKMRLTLARAVVKQPGLVLLDDPLAAVDVHTEELLMDRLICGQWKNCTRIVATHRLTHLNKFDRVVFLSNGQVAAVGSLDELLQHNEQFRTFVAEHGSADSMAHSLTPQTVTSQPTSTPARDGRLVDDEDRATGSIKSELFFSYLRELGTAGGKRAGWVYFWLVSSCLLVVFLPIAQSTWLAWWSDMMQSDQHTVLHWLRSPLTAVFVYGGIGLLVLAANYAERLVWMMRATNAGREIHNKTLSAVLAAPVRFFDTTPSGRILNRFAHDMAGVDDELSWNFESTFRSLAHMMGTLLLILLIVPYVVIAAIPALIVFYRVQRDYRRCAREAKRLASISRSPRYAHFKETIGGLSVIRAFGQQRVFTERFTEKLRYFQRMNWGSIMLNRWFSSRAPVLSGVIALATTCTVVVLCFHGDLSSGIAGVVITYSLTFWANLNWCVRSFSEVESRMTSYERLRSYAELVPEPSTSRTPALSPKDVWPLQGAIEFRNVSARYAPDLPLVLRSVTFTIPGGSRVGIVGRTGSGKTTIFQTLFRFVELSEGSIYIDGVDIARIPHARLRRSMAVIPQDPILFIGTVRTNLDRFNAYTDDAIWSALKRVQMDRTVERLGGLHAAVRENGLNLSQGQRQLLCLARAVLTQANIIVMDEATASVDVQTDSLIQATVREEFQGVTVIIIAHRLNSVADADMIIEMHNGESRCHDRVAEVPVDEIE